MPVSEITVLKGKLNAEQKTRLLVEVTRAVFKASGLPDTPRAWASLRTYINEVEPGTFAIAGKVQTLDDPTFYRIVVTFPAGWANQERKQGLVAEITQAVLKLEGTPIGELDRFRVQVLLPEIPDGNWGSGGIAMRLTDIAALFGVDLATLGS